MASSGQASDRQRGAVAVEEPAVEHQHIGSSFAICASSGSPKASGSMRTYAASWE